jgi:hypothetical protein
VIDKSTGDLGMFSVSREFYELGERLVRNATITYRDFFIEGRDLDNHIIIFENYQSTYKELFKAIKKVVISSEES